MAEWTKDQSDQITSLYEQLKGSYEKSANQKLFGGAQLPYEDAHNILVNLLKQQETEHHGGLEAATNAAHSEMNNKANKHTTRMQYALGLIGIVLALAVASSFAATVPLAAASYGTVAAYSPAYVI